MARNRAPKAFEIKFAYMLLRYLGGNVSNPYLILSIIAWVRAESGSKYIGNNPLNIRNSIYAVRYRYGKHGRFAVFANLQAAAKATAAFLKQHKGVGYEAIVRRLREQMPSGLSKEQQAAWQVDQAKDTIINIALSKWSSTHYGLGKQLSKYKALGANPTPEQVFNLIRIGPIWASMTGTKWSVPKDAEPKPPKPPPLPNQPRTLAHAVPEAKYLQPYDSYNFYTSRWAPSPVLAGDDTVPEW